MIKKLLVITAVLLILTACYIKTTGGTPAPTSDIVRYRITVDGVEYRCKGYKFYSTSDETHIDLIACEGYFGRNICIKDFTSVEIEDLKE